jgi:hypothetical protein
MRLSFVGPDAKRPTLLTLQESRHPRESASSAANRDNSPLGFTLGKSLRNRMVILAIVGSNSGSLRSSSGLFARRTSRVGLARPA